MKLTLMRLMILGAALPMMAAAQVPPKSPAPRARPAPKMEPMELFDMEPLMDMKLDELRFHDLDLHAQELGMRAQEKAAQAMSHIDMGQLKQAEMFARDAMSHIDIAQLKAGAEDMRFRAE